MLSLHTMIFVVTTLVVGAVEPEAAPKKVREGAAILWPLPEIALPEWRGALQLDRDRAVVAHTQRNAQLDAIVDWAKDHGDVRLIARAEDLRAQERRRYHVVMKRLHQRTVATILRGAP